MIVGNAQWAFRGRAMRAPTIQPLEAVKALKQSPAERVQICDRYSREEQYEQARNDNTAFMFAYNRQYDGGGSESYPYVNVKAPQYNQARECGDNTRHA
jgi:hypothetical protein